MDDEKKFRIVKMEKSDIPAVERIERLTFSDPWTAKDFSDCLALPEYCFFVAVPAESEECRPEIEGYLGMRVMADEAEVMNIAVREEVRRKGIGTVLLHAAKSHCRLMGVTALYLEARAGNLTAISLYRKEGFHEIGIRKNYYRKPAEDALVMQCPAEFL